MPELEAMLEKRLIDKLCTGESQWTYRPDIRNEKELWANFRYILEQNNKAKLNDVPLSDSEFDKIKNDDYAIIGLTRESPEIKAFAA